MIVALRLFIVAALFTGTLGAVYWVVARDPAGTMFLGCMTAALLTIAFYMVFAERNANLLADRKDAVPADAAGESLGSFTLHSPAPFWIGIAIAGVMYGLVVSPALAGLAIVALLFLAALMVVRSR